MFDKYELPVAIPFARTAIDIVYFF